MSKLAMRRDEARAMPLKRWDRTWLRQLSVANARSVGILIGLSVYGRRGGESASAFGANNGSRGGERDPGFGADGSANGLAAARAPSQGRSGGQTRAGGRASSAARGPASASPVEIGAADGPAPVAVQLVQHGHGPVPDAAEGGGAGV